MQREYQRWFSHVLQRDMEMLVFGHAGDRVLAFPQAMGPFYDWEDGGLIRSEADRIGRGHYQFYCVDSVDSESWCNPGPVWARARRHERYDQYLLNEVVPFSEGHNPNSSLVAAGAGFGGYHAVNFALRHPDRVQRVLGMSGPYDIRSFSDGHLDDAVYYNNPCEFIAGECDPARLHALKHLDIILAVGRDDSVRESNERLSGLLWEKGVGNALRIWEGLAHDWPNWQRMLHLYLGGHD
jgi:esterase/lipase superfamily enzyme